VGIIILPTAVPPGALLESRTIERGARARGASGGDEKDGTGSVHPDTLTSMNNLACMWKAAGHKNNTLELSANCFATAETKN
jgi:hypothetical protein